MSEMKKKEKNGFLHFLEITAVSLIAIIITLVVLYSMNPQKLKECMETWKEKLPVNGYHKSAVLLKTPIKKVNYDTIHKRIQRTGNFIV